MRRRHVEGRLIIWTIRSIDNCMIYEPVLCLFFRSSLFLCLQIQCTIICRCVISPVQNLCFATADDFCGFSAASFSQVHLSIANVASLPCSVLKIMARRSAAQVLAIPQVMNAIVHGLAPAMHWNEVIIFIEAADGSTRKTCIFLCLR